LKDWHDAYARDENDEFVKPTVIGEAVRNYMMATR
jgi:bisphosphoglycerate-independent phosphoglycerate mutase (AlkP superfamily)